MAEFPCLNTDRELWSGRDDLGNHVRVFVTEGGGIGMDLSGHVIVMPVRLWHLHATRSQPGEVASHHNTGRAGGKPALISPFPKIDAAANRGPDVFSNIVSD